MISSDVQLVDAQFDCKIHGLQNYKTLGLFKQSPYCPVCRDEAEQQLERQSNLDKKRKLVQKAGVSKRYFDKRFSDYKTDHERQKFVLNAVLDYGNHFSDHLKTGSNLILTGGIGTGKTHLAMCLVKKLIIHGFSAHITNMSNIVDEIKASYDRSDVHESAIFKRFRRYDLLVIDEVGVQKGSEYERNIAYKIINDRYEDVRPSVVISNANVQKMADYIDQRSVSRLLETGSLIVFDFDDYRVRS